MKTKSWLVAIVILVTAGGLWAARVAWRMHRQLITLDVRNMPLAEVLRRIEWQTWKTIRAEKPLDARITLHVTDKPLKEVLDQIAEQAGARWSTVYAVYQSATGRKALETALGADGKLEAVGWTKVAPKAPEFAQAGPEGLEPMVAGAGGPGSMVFRSRAISDDPGPAGGPDPQIGGGPPLPMGKGGMMLLRGNPEDGAMLSRNPSGQTEIWSPTELVIETALGARLGEEVSPSATAKGADQTAHQVNGKWTSYIAFRKSIMGVGFAGPGGRPGDLLRRRPNDRFARLTPEQRVQRARERREFEAGGGLPGLPGQQKQ